jgi:hypothetical protein
MLQVLDGGLSDELCPAVKHRSHQRTENRV